jgi:hypothetical protein
MMPELAKKMASIMALREMLDMRLTPQLISKALPSLKELREAEKALQSRSEQIIEEEKKALLAASPDDPLPMGSGEKLQKENAAFRTKQEGIWEGVSKSLGEDRVNRLRMLIGQGPNRPFFPPGGPQPPRGGLDAPPPPAEEELDNEQAPPPPDHFLPVALSGARLAAQDAPLRPQGQDPFAPRRGTGQGRGGQGQPPFFPGGPGMGPMMPFGQPSLTLADLIDLMEQKLAAMKR